MQTYLKPKLNFSELTSSERIGADCVEKGYWSEKDDHGGDIVPAIAATDAIHCQYVYAGTYNLNVS